MKLRIKVGTHAAQVYHVCRLRKPAVGQTFQIVDKTSHGAKPLAVRLTEIRTHTGGGDIYFVELF